MTEPLRTSTCCFSGYRPEKITGCPAEETGIPAFLAAPLHEAVCAAAAQGCTHFVTGMSRGFDLWAAQTVLELADALHLSLICAIPFDGQDADWAPAWRTLYDQVLRRAAQVYLLSPTYTPGCFHARNRFLVDAATRLICYYDGLPGGTAYTVRYARHCGLELVNLADPQLALEGFAP
ncbi:MAG: SLOG family protein [Intestinibacillus sp.]